MSRGRAVVGGALLGALALVALASVLVRLGWAADVLPRAAGPAPWIASRALGITSYVALSIEVIFGLAMSTGAGDRLLPRARTHELHRFLSALALGSVGAHAALLLGDGFARFDALDVLVPFAARVRRAPVALGVLAAYAMLVVHASFALRGRIGARTWRRLHYASFALYLGATAHGIAAGTDAARVWMTATYGVSLGTVALLTWRRIALGRPRAAGARPAAERGTGLSNLLDGRMS